MKNYHKGFIVPLVILIIAVLIIGGGIYYYSQNKNSQQNTNSQTNILVNTQTNSNDWKTYSNLNYGFEFQYPSNWTVQDISYTYQGNKSPVVNIISPTRHDITGYEQIGATYNVQLQFYGGKANVTLNSFVKTHEAGEQDAHVIPTTDAIKNTNEYKFAQQIITSAKITSNAGGMISSGTSPSTQGALTLQTYTNSQYGFTFQYSGNLVDADTNPRSYYDHNANPSFTVIKRMEMRGSQTSGDERIAGLIQFSVATSSNAITTCLTSRTPDEMNNTFNVGNITINGIQFAKYDSSSSDVGNRFGERVFSTVHNNECYRIEIIENGVGFTVGPNVSEQTAINEATKYGFPFNAYDMFVQLTPVAMSLSFTK